MYCQSTSSTYGELLLPLTLKPEAKVYVASRLAQVDAQKREQLQQLAEKVQLGAEETFLLLPLSKYMAKCFIAYAFLFAASHSLAQERSPIPAERNLEAMGWLLGPMMDIYVQMAKSETYCQKIRIFFQIKT